MFSELFTALIILLVLFTPVLTILAGVAWDHHLARKSRPSGGFAPGVFKPKVSSDAYPVSFRNALYFALLPALLLFFLFIVLISQALK
jgi:hypothetical protein